MGVELDQRVLSPPEVGVIMASKDVRIQIPGTCEYVIYMARCIEVCRWNSDCLSADLVIEGLPRWALCNHKCPYE